MFYEPFLKKSGRKKNCKKGPICFDLLDGQDSFFSKKVQRNEFWFFALQPVHQDASFKLSNITIRQFSFFTFVRVKGTLTSENTCNGNMLNKLQPQEYCMPLNQKD